MDRSRIVIVGAGVAGVSLAYFLSRLGINDVTVIEAEKMAGMHSSGRSNSNFIHLFEPPAAARLSAASEQFLYRPPYDFSEKPLVVSQGAIVAVSGDDVKRHAEEMRYARDLGIAVEEIGPEKIRQLVPVLSVANIAVAAYYPESGPIDTSELIALYIRHSRARGVAFHYERSFAGIDSANGKVVAVRTSKGPIACDIFVNAAGAWAGRIGESSGAMPIPFSAKRRHLISVRLPPEFEHAKWPFVRCNSIPMYFKAENGRVVASPMDEDEIPPQDCPTDDLRVAQIADELNMHTAIKVRHIEHSWAGLRTFAKDRLPVVGFDDRLEGFFWLAGQGGTGIQSSPAIGRIASRLIAGEAPGAEAAALSPSRWN